MMKGLHDRLGHALLGFAFGAILGVVAWWLYDVGLSVRWGAPDIHLGLKQWIQYVGGGFAVLGFLLKDRPGGAVGMTAAGVYELDRPDGRIPEVPRGLALLVLLAVPAGVW